MLFMAASSKSKTASQTALMVQLINTAFAVSDADFPSYDLPIS